MNRWDETAAAWLDERRVRLEGLGVLTLLERTVATVWERNVERHDPDVAGDTATSLGLTAAENLRTLLGRTPPPPGVTVSAPRNSVLVGADDLRIHLMKAPDPGLGVDAVPVPDWSATSWTAAGETRHAAAVENSRRYHGVDPVDQPPLPGLEAAPGDPRRLRHLVLLWAGHPVTAATAGWLAIPTAGARPWLAARAVWSHGPDDVPAPVAPPVVVPSARRPARGESRLGRPGPAPHRPGGAGESIMGARVRPSPP